MNMQQNTAEKVVSIQAMPSEKTPVKAKLPVTAENYPRQFAYKKLKAEKESAKDVVYADLILSHLMERVKEDYGLSHDILQEHKTWQKCFSYITERARKMADKSNCAMIIHYDVFEWAEDYYHLDDKAEEDRKAAEAEEQKKKAEKDRKRRLEKVAPAKESDNDEISAVSKFIDTKKTVKGQMSIFDLMGGRS